MMTLRLGLEGWVEGHYDIVRIRSLVCTKGPLRTRWLVIRRWTLHSCFVQLRSCLDKLRVGLPRCRGDLLIRRTTDDLETKLGFKISNGDILITRKLNCFSLCDACAQRSSSLLAHIMPSPH